MNKIIQGHVLDVLKGMDSESIDCCITSPPYWSLRDYKVEPIIWGNQDCQHEWGDGIHREKMAGPAPKLTIKGVDNFQAWKNTSHFCLHCNAWKGQLGLEPTFELYIDHLIEIFSEVKRVLKKTGTLWVNLGDSYAGSGGAGGDWNNGNRAKEPKWRQAKVNMPSKSLCNIPHRFSIAMTDRLGMILRNTLIWHKPNCLNGSTVLYAKTQKGVHPSTLKDLVRLKPETVELWDGAKWQTVKEWTENKEPRDTKELLLRNGEAIKCTGDHLFPIGESLKKASELVVGDVLLNTKMLPISYRAVAYIPDSIGWLIGLYLAEGSIGDKGRCLQISSHSKETKRFERLKEIAEGYDATCYKYNQGDTATFNIYSRLIIALVREYIVGNNAKTKHLTNNIWQRGNGFLHALLRGYLEGDGHYDESNNRYRIGFAKNKALARDLRTLCARLGLSIKLQASTSKFNGKTYPMFRGEIRYVRSDHWNKKSDYEIVEIKTPKKQGKYWDVVLEHEPHLFATHSGALIHNCMPQSAKDRFTVDFEYIFFFTKSQKYYFKQLFEPYLEPLDRWGGPNKKLTDELKGDEYESMHRERDMRPNEQGRNKRCVWKYGDIETETKHRQGMNKDRGLGLVEKRNLPEQKDFVDKLRACFTIEEVVKKTNIAKTKIEHWFRYDNSGFAYPSAEDWALLETDLFPELLDVYYETDAIESYPQGKNKRTVWQIPTQPSPEAHFATFPNDLVQPMIEAGCPEQICKACGKAREVIYKQGNIVEQRQPERGKMQLAKNELGNTSLRDGYTKRELVPNGLTDCGCNAGWDRGIVLDPFAGTGTTCYVAKEMGRNYIGIDINPDYCNIAEKKNAQVMLL